MSLHFLIDGYNCVKSTPVFERKSLADGRQALIQWLTVSRPQGSRNNQVTVVFDGRSDVYGDASTGEIRVIFTQDTSADDCIREMVEDHARPKDLVVVSNDKDITIYARALGAAIISIEQFTQQLRLNQVKSQSTHKKSKIVAPTKYISHTQADAINKELRKLWTKND